MQWGGIKNGALLTLIEREGFDVFLTGDKNMDKQQRLEGRRFAVLIMSAINFEPRFLTRETAEGQRTHYRWRPESLADPRASSGWGGISRKSSQNS